MGREKTEVERLLDQKTVGAERAEGDHSPFFMLNGDYLTVNVATYWGRQAARMLVFSMARDDMKLAAALLKRVGLES